MGDGIARIEEPGGLARGRAGKIIEEQRADLGNLRRDHAPAGLQVVEGHVDRLHDVRQGEAVANIRIPLQLPLEFLHSAQEVGILEHVLVPALDYNNERLDAAKVLLNLQV